jgi:microcystin-dependent protein
MSSPYVGEIRMGGWNFAPSGWAFCNGALVAISQNPTLFQLIGTTYGGDGVNNYALPDLQGRLPVHQGTNAFGTFTIGQSSGTETVTLTTSQIQSHSHPLGVSTAGAASTDPTGQTFAASSLDVYVPAAKPTPMSDSTTSTGGGQPHDNRMPYLCISFVISLFGIFPSQV